MLNKINHYWDIIEDRLCAEPKHPKFWVFMSFATPLIICTLGGGLGF